MTVGFCGICQSFLGLPFSAQKLILVHHIFVHELSFFHSLLDHIDVNDSSGLVHHGAYLVHCKVISLKCRRKVIQKFSISIFFARETQTHHCRR